MQDEIVNKVASSGLITISLEELYPRGERVLLDILLLSGPDRSAVEELVARARRDYRDILLWAEYPEESRLDTPEKVERFRDAMRRLGVSVRVPEPGSGGAGGSGAAGGEGDAG